jgi:hypothetical protein
VATRRWTAHAAAPQRDLREFLVEEYGEDGLPFNTRFGDGAPIDEEVVQIINQAYDAHTRREPWEAGDLLLVDNLRTAHSRESYEGPREVLVALAEASRVGASSLDVERIDP